MQVLRPTEADKERFRALVPVGSTIEVKPMFGNLGAYVNGNMFMGLFGSAIGLKLSDTDRVTLLAVDGAGPFGPPELPMAPYVTLPSAWRTRRKETAVWIARSLEYVGAMPPKVSKKK